MFRRHGTWFWIVIGAVAVACVFYFPSLIAFRYTASSQSTSFLSHPWRSWAFLYTALTVPGDSQLKTSGAALRAAEGLLDRRQFDVEQVRLLFLPAGRPYEMAQTIDGYEVHARIVPSQRFVWQVEAGVRALPEAGRVIVMLLDYRSGRVLWDGRDQLPRVLQPAVSPTASAPARTSLRARPSPVLAAWSPP